IKSVHYVDVRQSMKNGGGPACLRLSVELNDYELAHVPENVMLNNAMYAKLVDWVNRHYRDHLAAADLADPKLIDEGRAALDELSHLLSLGPIYDFQR